MNNLHQVLDSKEVNNLSMVQVEVMAMVVLRQVDMVDLVVLEVIIYEFMIIVLFCLKQTIFFTFWVLNIL